jgi:GntR family transcriptional regulator/MocR family aminotransferase
MMTTGRYDRHVRRMRGVYSHRRRALVDAVLHAAPQARLSGLAGGFHAVLHLPEDASEATVVAAARERSIGLYALSAYRTQATRAAPALVIGFGNCSTENITAGIAEIADLLQR